jgi:hypothetical protein
MKNSEYAAACRGGQRRRRKRLRGEKPLAGPAPPLFSSAAPRFDRVDIVFSVRPRLCLAAPPLFFSAGVIFPSAAPFYSRRPRFSLRDIRRMTVPHTVFIPDVRGFPRFYSY